MLSLYDIAALVLVVSATFGWLNRRFIHLPHTIGLLILGLAMSLALIVVNDVVPESRLLEAFTGAIGQIDFFDTMMNGMLAFLLFAGALQIDFGKLKMEAAPIGLMATVGVLISTAVVGVGMWLAARVLGVDLPLVWALTFGALISPTDPVAVLALLKSMRLPEALEISIAGESLFNDGVGVVVFTVLLSVAVTGGDVSLVHAAKCSGRGGRRRPFRPCCGIRRRQCHGGHRRLFGRDPDHAGAGHRPLRGGDPSAHVGAHRGRCCRHPGWQSRQVTAMSETTRVHLFQFWDVIDQLLNSTLFVLIGLEVLVIVFVPELVLLALLAIPVVLVARYVSVAGPIALLSLGRRFTPGSVTVLVAGAACAAAFPWPSHYLCRKQGLATRSSWRRTASSSSRSSSRD